MKRAADVGLMTMRFESTNPKAVVVGGTNAPSLCFEVISVVLTQRLAGRDEIASNDICYRCRHFIDAGHAPANAATLVASLPFNSNMRDQSMEAFATA